MNITLHFPRAWAEYDHPLLLGLPIDIPTAGVLASVLVVATVVKVFFKANSLRWLMICGGLLMSLLVISLLLQTPRTQGEDPTLWPVILGAGVFLYLWWLAGLLLELSFTWHQYMRGEVLSKRMQTWFEEKVVKASQSASGGTDQSS
ncbi:MAG: hypothetical protein JWQ44_1434 [Chthoniobacter sp.]|nr:hypothetical protein [Chthoniobacter sp.]